MNKQDIQFIDLGLPSGKLWATENVKDENGNEAFPNFDEAVKTFGKNLPSKEDWEELFDNCSYKWNKKKKGYDVTGPNNKSIFLPAVGRHSGFNMYYVRRCGYYWSSSIDYKDDAYFVCFDKDKLYPLFNFSHLYDGFSVRLVR